MSFIKLSHADTPEPTAPDFFVNMHYVTRITPRPVGCTLFLHDGTSVAVQQNADTIADYVDQLEASRGAAKISVDQK